jgi:aminoglycoside phosphotransferase (APT) family kinase protein
MVPGTAEEARWRHTGQHLVFPLSVLERMIQSVLPRCRVLGMEPLAGGLRNASFKVHLHSLTEPVVLRIHQHDASLCQKEIDIIRLIGTSVPVSEVIGAKPNGLDGTPPFLLMRFIEGLSFRELRRKGDMEAIAKAAYSAGETLAAIGLFHFPQQGWIAPGPTITKSLLAEANHMPRFVDGCLESANLQKWMAADLRDRTGALVWSWATQLAAIENTSNLVHGDFNRRNLLVRPTAGHWTVAAVLDWEFAISGTPLVDFATFLRYEQTAQLVTEPHFSTGYLSAGGKLPENWRQLAKVIDLASLCESLTHKHLPEEVAVELVELVRTTVTNGMSGD